MSALTEELADVAVELITEEGRPITIQSKVKTLDPAQPWKLTGTTTTDQPAIGAFFDSTLSDLEMALAQVLGAPEGARTNLSIKGTRCYIPARDLATPIALNDVILDGTKTWEIIDFELIEPGTVPVLYICVLGR